MEASVPKDRVQPRAIARTGLDAAAAFRTHHEFVWRVIVAAGVPLSAVDDVVQDVFVTVHRRRRAYDGRAPVRHWIYGIARGIARNHCRKAARAANKRRALAADAAVAQHESPTDPDAAIAGKQVRDLVVEFVCRLPVEQREVFTLVQLEGMAVPEIAVMLDAPLNTVYSRLRLARKRFETMAARLRSEGRA